MTAIGLKHYGGTRGLYNEPTEEWSRALGYYEHVADLNVVERSRRRRDREIAKRRAG